MSSEWDNSVVGCLSDLSTCICGLLCCPCTLGSINEELGDSYLGGCCTAVVYPFCSCFFRQKFREAYDIDGNLCQDCLVTWLCPFCSTCQMKNEIMSRGSPPNQTMK